MIKFIHKTFWTAIVLLSLLFLPPLQALAADAADTVDIDTAGTVSILSDRLAAEKVSSLQVRVLISPADGESVGFSFDAAVAGRITSYSYRDGALNIYVAGSVPLMAEGQAQLTLGTISGGDLEPANKKSSLK